jgi:hypothetical protein
MAQAPKRLELGRRLLTTLLSVPPDNVGRKAPYLVQIRTTPQLPFIG